MKVETADSYRLRITFPDGFTGEFDAEPLRWGDMFAPLKDRALFTQVKAENGTIFWPNGADLCPDVLYGWCKVGRVLSHEAHHESFRLRADPSAVHIKTLARDRAGGGAA